jgi:hypothetical protein
MRLPPVPTDLNTLYGSNSMQVRGVKRRSMPVLDLGIWGSTPSGASPNTAEVIAKKDCQVSQDTKA